MGVTNALSSLTSRLDQDVALILRQYRKPAVGVGV